MTVKEATGIVYMLHTNFIGQDRKATEQDLAARVNLYAAVFKDDDAELVREAAMQCIETCKFIPTIAEIKEALTRVTYLKACKRSADLLAERLKKDALASSTEDLGGFLPYET